jgi:membrane protein
MFLVIAIALSLVYRFGPDHRRPQWEWITWGSGIAALLWIIASLLFSWYAADFGSFNKTYGSLGAIIGFMVWIWVSLIVVLLGAETDTQLKFFQSVKPYRSH